MTMPDLHITRGAAYTHSWASKTSKKKCAVCGRPVSHNRKGRYVCHVTPSSKSTKVCRVRPMRLVYMKKGK